MKQYKDSFFPDKANDFIDNDGNFKGETVGKVVPLTEDPLEDNLTTNIKIVSLNEEPGVRYKGYVYAIGLRYFPITFHLVNCQLSIEQPISMKETEDLEFYVIPDEGYEFDPTDALGFFVNGVDDYTFNPSTGYVKLENPLGEVVMGCRAVKMVNVHYDLHNIALNPMPEKISASTFRLGLEASVVGGSDYRLSQVFISCIGASANLRLNTLYISNVTATDDIYIEMSAAHKVSAETTIENGTCDFDQNQLWNDAGGSGRITPNVGYGYPETVNASGFLGFSYNATNGYFSFSQAMAIGSYTVSISAECPKLYPIVSDTQGVVLVENNPTMRLNDVKQVTLRGADNHYQEINVTDVIGALDWNYNSNTSTLTISGVAEGYDEIEIVSEYVYHYLFSNQISNASIRFEPSSTSSSSAVVYGYISANNDKCFHVPSTISLSNAELISYDNSTGAFSFTNVTGDVNVSGQLERFAVEVNYPAFSHYDVIVDNVTINNGDAILLGEHSIEASADYQCKFDMDHAEVTIYGNNYRHPELSKDTSTQTISFNVTLTSGDTEVYLDIVAHDPSSQSGSGSGSGSGDDKVTTHIDLENCTLHLDGETYTGYTETELSTGNHYGYVEADSDCTIDSSDISLAKTIDYTDYNIEYTWTEEGVRFEFNIDNVESNWQYIGISVSASSPSPDPESESGSGN